MNFKEQLQSDIEEVFLNLDEFAEIHNIEGKKIPVVMDTDQMDKNVQILGLIEADMLIMGKENDFPANLEPGRMLNVDGREMIVANVSRKQGIVEVALRQNRTY